jgi:hypothetical protein
VGPAACEGEGGSVPAEDVPDALLACEPEAEGVCEALCVPDALPEALGVTEGLAVALAELQAVALPEGVMVALGEAPRLSVAVGVPLREGVGA